MLYISFLFILIGLLVFFYAVFKETGLIKIKVKQSDTIGLSVESSDMGKTSQKEEVGSENKIIPENLYPDDYQPEEKDNSEIKVVGKSSSDDEGQLEVTGKIYSDDRIVDAVNKKSSIISEMNEFMDGKHYEESMISSKTEELPHPDSNNFVLFEDSSSLINYINGTGIIDSTLKEYNNIKRIGKGRFVLDREGINFYMENRLFRFDFYRTDEIHTGENYISVFIKGSDSVKLFLVDHEKEIIELVKEQFRNYKECS